MRRAAGDTPLAIIPFNPRGLERRPSTWPRFPWAELAELSDAFAPMAYTGGAFKGFDATYGYVTRAIRLLRFQTGDPNVAIHVAGGVADRLGPEELAGFAAAVSDDGGTIGLSLYDWETTPAGHWRVLRQVTSVGGLGTVQSSKPVSGLEQVLGQHFHVCEDWHEVRIARPAWDDVEVHVVGDAGAGRTTQIPAQVEALRAVRAAERVDARDGELVELERLGVRQLSQRPNVPERGRHEMAGGVRVLVQQHDRGGSAVHDERVRLRQLASALVAEDASRQLVRLGDVFETPRRPERLRHEVVLS